MAPPRDERADALEVRFSSVGDDGTVEGRAVRFGVVDSYGTTFGPSAFDGSRAVPMLWNHDPGQVLGSWSEFRRDGDALVVRGRLNLAVARAQEVRALITSGDVSGLSVGFRTVKDERRGSVRHILRADLREISVVAFPAVPGSGVTAIRTDDRAGAAVRLAEAARSAARAIHSMRT